MNPESHNCEFSGKSTGKLDDRKRMTLPAEWRKLMEEQMKMGGKFLAAFDPFRGVIRVYAPSSTEQILKATENPFAASLEVAETLEEFIANSEILEKPDTAGRVLLDGGLLKLANITKEVRFTAFGRSGFTIASDELPEVDRQSDNVRRYQECMKVVFAQALTPAVGTSQEELLSDVARGNAAKSALEASQAAANGQAIKQAVTESLQPAVQALLQIASQTNLGTAQNGAR